jgi:sulfur-oxidizing protein SoxZ
MADAPRIRTLIDLPELPRRGVPFMVRTSIAHPMEHGLRSDGYGNVVPRSIVTRFECRLGQELAFAVDLFPAVAANPYFAFWLRVEGPSTLSFEWTGDNGFAHRETRKVEPT